MLGPKLKVFSLPTTFHFGTKYWKNRTFKYLTKPYPLQTAMIERLEKERVAAEKKAKSDALRARFEKKRGV